MGQAYSGGIVIYNHHFLFEFWPYDDNVTSRF